jgi:hypothetical protein
MPAATPDLIPQLGSGHISELGGLRDAIDHGLQHGSPGLAQYVARDRSQFDIGILQNFFNPVRDCGPLLDEDSPIAIQIAQFPDWFGWNQASAQQPML